MRHEFPRSERTEEEKKAIANGEADENGQYNLDFDKKEEISKKDKLEIRPSTEEELEEDRLDEKAEQNRVYHKNPYKGEAYLLEQKGKTIAEAIEISKGFKERIKEFIVQEFYNAYHSNPQINVENPSIEEIRKRAQKTKEQYPQHEPVVNILLHIKAYNNIKKCIEELESDQIEDFLYRVKSINSNIHDFSFFLKGQSEWSKLLNILDLNTKK
jgi:hypothetical protein